MAESETSTQQHGRTRSFLALSQSFFCRETKSKRSETVAFPLVLVLSLGFVMTKEGGWLVLLLWKICCSQGNRTGQMVMKNKPPICL